MTTTLPNLAQIAAGEFLMGAPDGEEDERPVHRVFVDAFEIGRSPVTQDEYARFVQTTGYPAPAIRDLPIVAGGGRDSVFKELAASYVWNGDGPPPGYGSHPVVLIRYDDCTAYCRWLSEELGGLVRLPSEAEWERAARGGLEGRQYPWGDDISPSKCHFLNDGATKFERGTKPAGTYAPNAFGLCDVAGNVWEWVSDWYSKDAYASGTAPSAGTMR